MPTVDPVSENVMKLPPSQRRTVQAARRMVKSAAPKATEVAARSRSIPSASHSIFEGAGKQFRYIRLRAPADVERSAVKRIVRKAFKLGGS